MHRKISHDTAQRFYKILCALAQADGKVSQKEEEWLARYHVHWGLSYEEALRLQKEALGGSTCLPQTQPTPEECKELMLALAKVAKADGTIDDSERDYMFSVARRLSTRVDVVEEAIQQAEREYAEPARRRERRDALLVGLGIACAVLLLTTIASLFLKSRDAEQPPDSLSIASRKNSPLETENRALRDQLSQGAVKVDELTTERDHLKGNLARSEKDAAEKDKALRQGDDRSQRIADLIKEVAVLERKISELQKDKDGLQEDFDKVCIVRDVLTREVAKLKQDLINAGGPQPEIRFIASSQKDLYHELNCFAAENINRDFCLYFASDADARKAGKEKHNCRPVR